MTGWAGRQVRKPIAIVGALVLLMSAFAALLALPAGAATNLGTVTVGAQSPASVAPGASATYAVSVTYTGSNETAITWSASSLATGVTATFVPPSANVPSGGNASPFNATLTLATTALTPVGTHTFTVTATDGNQAVSNTTPTLVVSGAATTTTVTNAATLAATPSVVGQAYQVDFSVTSASGAPTAGTATVSDGTATCNGNVGVGGTGACNLTSTTAGLKSITATYNGDASFATSTSTGVPHTVNAANTTTTVTSNNNPSVFGQNVTFTATVVAVAPGTGTPTGSVIFTIDGSAGASILLSGGSASTSTALLTVSGSPHTVSAAYTSNSSNHSNSNGSLASGQNVNAAGTTTTVFSSVNPSKFGQSVTFTATVVANSPGSGTPTGTVTFTVSGDNETVALSGGSAGSSPTASLTVSGSPHAVSATYNGSTNFSTSNDTLPSQTVDQASTTTTITNLASLKANSTVVGEPYQVDVTIAAVSPGGGTPTGTVLVGDGAGSTCLITLSGGSGSCNLTSTITGNKFISASYSGDTNFASSSFTASGGDHHQVKKADTTTTVTSDINPSVVGENVTFTATVTVDLPGAGTPAGSVVFTIDGTPGSSIPLAAGTATTSTSTLTPGSHSVSAAFTASGAPPNFSNSSGSLPTQVVNAGNSSTSVASDINPSVFGQNVTFTATVSAVLPAVGTPTGTVTFTIDGAPTADSPVALTGSTASTSTAALSISGSPHSLSATYNGDSSFGGSTGSLAAGQTVNQAGTSVSLGSDSNPSVFGENVTFTATVSASAPGAGTPTGTVTFTIDGTPTGDSPVTVSGGSASTSTAGLAVGNRNIVATYSGDTSFSGDSDGLTQTVNQADTSTSLSSDFNPSVFGQSVTFTATVSITAPGAGTPTGSVDFVIDGTPTTVGLSGLTATLTTSTLGVGPHTVSAAYGGSSSFATSNDSLPTQTVNRGSTTTGVTSSQNPSLLGGSVTFTATVGVVAPAAGTPTGSVDFVIDGTPTTVALSGLTATLTTSALGVGSHTVTAAYSGNSDFDTSTGSLAGGQSVIQVSSGGTDGTDGTGGTGGTGGGAGGTGGGAGGSSNNSSSDGADISTATSITNDSDGDDQPTDGNNDDNGVEVKGKKVVKTSDDGDSSWLWWLLLLLLAGFGGFLLAFRRRFQHQAS